MILMGGLVDDKESNLIYSTNTSQIHWKLEQFKLPMKMLCFGCIVYRERFVLLIAGFGLEFSYFGSAKKSDFDSLYLWDTRASIWKWTKLAIKCPFKVMCYFFSWKIRELPKIHLFLASHLNNHNSVSLCSFSPTKNVFQVSFVQIFHIWSQLWILPKNHGNTSWYILVHSRRFS